MNYNIFFYLISIIIIVFVLSFILNCFIYIIKNIKIFISKTNALNDDIKNIYLILNKFSYDICDLKLLFYNNKRILYENNNNINNLNENENDKIIISKKNIDILNDNSNIIIDVLNDNSKKNIDIINNTSETIIYNNPNISENIINPNNSNKIIDIFNNNSENLINASENINNNYKLFYNFIIEQIKLNQLNYNDVLFDISNYISNNIDNDDNKIKNILFYINKKIDVNNQNIIIDFFNNNFIIDDQIYTNIFYYIYDEIKINNGFIFNKKINIENISEKSYDELKTIAKKYNIKIRNGKKNKTKEELKNSINEHLNSIVVI